MKLLILSLVLFSQMSFAAQIPLDKDMPYFKWNHRHKAVFFGTFPAEWWPEWFIADEYYHLS